MDYSNYTRKMCFKREKFSIFLIQIQIKYKCMKENIRKITKKVRQKKKKSSHQDRCDSNFFFLVFS